MSVASQPKALHNYTDEYKEQTFLTWYKNGRPAVRVLQTLIPPYYDQIPPPTLLAKWVRDLAWHERADTLDAEVSRRIEARAIEEKVHMLEEHALVGHKLRDMGERYFDDHEIDNSNVALKAIISGIEIEKTSRGMANALTEIATMSDQKLIDLVGKLIGRTQPEDFKGEEVENKIEEEPSDYIEGDFSSDASDIPDPAENDPPY